MNKIIALVGMPGAGKSVIAEHFKHKSYQYVYFGGITMKEVKVRGLEINPETEKIVREDLRKKYGMGAYAKLIIPEIDEKLKDGNVIADGLYSWSEYKILKEKYNNNLKILAVFAPPELRYERLSSREVRPISKDDAKKRDFDEILNLEKGGPIAMADYTLLNTGDLNYLLHQMESLEL
ncbi:AAA family ATPase [Candidatus Peregrinibacteria bacterium]|nr:AAA family ATPase [Candidatus Peregrinibacteria bacterium]